MCMYIRIYIYIIYIWVLIIPPSFGILQQNWSFPLVHSPRYLRAVADVSAQTSLGLEPSAILWKQQRLSCRVPWVLFIVRSCVTLWFPVDPFHPFWQLLAIDLCWIAPVSATLQIPHSRYEQTAIRGWPNPLSRGNKRPPDVPKTMPSSHGGFLKGWYPKSSKSWMTILVIIEWHGFGDSPFTEFPHVVPSVGSL